MHDQKPTLEDAFAIMAALARTTTQIGDASLIELVSHVEKRLADFTLDTPPEEVRAVLDMLDTAVSVIRSLADEAV